MLITEIERLKTIESKKNGKLETAINNLETIAKSLDAISN